MSATRPTTGKRSARLLTDLLQDLGVGWRNLRARPFFALVAISTLALGIGANATIFSVVDAVLLRPLPLPHPERLVSLWEVTPEGDDHNVVSRGNYMDWRDQTTLFEELGAYGSTFGWTYRVPEGEPVRIRGALWTPEAFRVLGVDAALGRTFTREEGLPGNDAVAVLSHGLWQRRFGADPAVLGRSITVDDERLTVVGVMPPGFSLPGAEADSAVDVWAPWALGEEERQQRRSHNLHVIGRLRPGVSIAQARAELATLAAHIAELHPENMTGWGVNVQPFRADLVASTRPLLILLLGVACLVLLLACANLANLLLARALTREREVAVRSALGAERGRLLRQLLTEAGLLATLGGCVGLAVTVAGRNLFVALAPADIPLLERTSVDWRVVVFSAGAALFATLLFGLLPALRTTTDLESTFRASDGRIAGTAHARLRSALLVLEIALAATLLVGSGLLVRTFVVLQQQDYGFERDHVLAATLDLPSARYPNGTVDQVRFYRTLLERTAELPGVVAAAGSSDLPAGFGSMTFSFAIEGRPHPGPNPREAPQPLRLVTPGYFRTLRIPLHEGRAFSPDDDADAPPVLVINEALRRLHWPDQDPVGQRLSFDGPQGPWLTIVGVVGDTRHYAMDAVPGPALYMPYAQKRWQWASWLNLLVRTEGDPLALAPQVRAQVQALDEQLLPGRIARLADLYAETNARRRFATSLMTAFALLALVLGTIGVHGVLAFEVARRRRELGLRIVLGASHGAVASRVVREGLALALAGIAIGAVAAYALSRFLENLVYGIALRDPLTFVVVPLVLLLLSALATYLPARRATRVDPVQALRAD